MGGMLCAAFVLFFLKKLNWNIGLDTPDGVRKSHTHSISRLGGVWIFLSVSICTLVTSLLLPEFIDKWWPVLLCNVLIFALGLLDDLRPLGAKIKLIGQILIAVVAYNLGLGIERVTNPLSGSPVEVNMLLSFTITVVWLIAIPNLVNLIDGMDGLASGLGLFLCLTVGCIGVMSNQEGMAFLSLSMAGALFGFLLFNFPPAKIFLGDGGAYLIGFFIASVSLQGSNKGSVIAALLVVIVALGLPILDTLFAILRRAVRGLPVFRADAEHVHHRLLSLGFTKSKALISMYAVCVALSLIGISVFMTRGFTLPIAGALLFILAVFGARFLGYIKKWSGARGQLQRALARRRETQYAHWRGQLLELEVDRCLSPAEFWTEFERGLERVGFIIDPESTNVPMAKLEIAVPGEGTWTLHHPISGDKNWDGLADCFQSAYVLGRRKWRSFEPDDNLAPSEGDSKLQVGPSSS